MKNLSSIINIVLGLAIAVLFFLQFSKPQTSQSSKGSNDSASSLPGAANGLKIAYINSDSIIVKFDYYFDLRKQLENKRDELETKYANKEQEVQAFGADAMQKIQKGLVTRAEAEQLDMQMRGKQQELLGLREKYMTDLSELEIVQQRKVYNRINEYLENNYKDKGYHLILGHQFADNILYIDKSFDITSEVIKGLNTEYANK